MIFMARNKQIIPEWNAHVSRSYFSEVLGVGAGVGWQATFVEARSFLLFLARIS